MEICLQRRAATQHSTPGTMSGVVAGIEFVTLEPPPAPDPAFHNSPICIPAGRYQVRMYPSKTFKMWVPLLFGVPGRSGIEIHFGNETEAPGSTKVDPLFLTEGCILVGMERLNDDEILRTVEACKNHVWPAISGAELIRELVWITVSDPAA